MTISGGIEIVDIEEKKNVKDKISGVTSIDITVLMDMR